MDDRAKDADVAMLPLGEDYADIRAGVRAICVKYPGEYWRKLERNDEYADDFVNELSAAGYLGALIPEEYGGAGLPLRAGCVILEEIHASGCSAAACHAQMYMMGTLLRHGSEEQKRRYLPEDRHRRNPLSGVRRDRADHRLRHHPAQNAGRPRRRPLRRQRPEDLDLAGPQIRPDATAGAHDAGRRGQAAHGGIVVPAGRDEGRGRQGPDHPSHRHHDQSPDQRAVLRRPQGAGAKISSARKGRASATFSTA